MDLFDFLTPKKGSFDISTAKEYAQSVASSFINSNVAPNESIQKLAAAEGLTPNQIEVIVTTTNQLIHSERYKTASSKYHAAEFPLADTKVILDALKIDGGEKRAAAFVDPKLSEDRHFDFEKAFGVKIPEIDKTASTLHNVKVVKQKLDLLHTKMASRDLVMQSESKDLETKFIKEARQTILQNCSNASERYSCIGAIYHMAKQAGLKDDAGKPLAKLAKVLQAEGFMHGVDVDSAVEFFMSKEADQKAPEHLISKELTGVEITNGQHPLYISLNTLAIHNKEKAVNENAFKRVRDTLEGLEQRIRAL